MAVGTKLYDRPRQPAPAVAVKADEIEAIIEELLDAQQDINLAANSHMDQSLCDASALIDRIETLLRRVKTSALSAQVQDVADKGWLVEHSPASTLIYCLKQDGWRKGKPVLVNDITIRIENANKSYHALGHIAAAILHALPAAPAAKQGEAE